MTKFKKCDYCKMENKTVKKYKSAFSKLGEATKTITIPSGVMIATMHPDVFHLCDGCLEFLVPPEKILRNNRIDNDFFEEELRDKLDKKFKRDQTKYVRGNSVKRPTWEYVSGKETK